LDRHVEASGDRFQEVSWHGTAMVEQITDLLLTVGHAKRLGD
jgi:hypothetical protein